MNAEAMTTHESTDLWNEKRLLLDSFGISKKLLGNDLYAWVNAAQAATTLLVSTMAVHPVEVQRVCSPLTGPVFGYLTWSQTDTGDTTARSLDIPQTLQKWCQLVTEGLPDSSTALVCARSEDPWLRNQREQKKVEDRIDRIFRAAVGEDFEDGMSSRFSRQLIELVSQFGDRAMPEISFLILYNRATQEVASEALRWLGSISHSETQGWRLWLLEKSLKSSSHMVRDGAVLGLVSMGDLTAAAYLTEAMAVEEYDELREDIQQALSDLEAAASGAITQTNKEA